jgi:uncharacterized protein YegJ (DUF2314 family)
MARLNRWSVIAGSLLTWACVASFLVAVCASHAAADDRPAAQAPGEPKMISIVFLLKEPRKLDEASLRTTAAKAYGKPFGTQPSDPNFVAKFKEPMYGIRIDGVQLGLINVDRPYIDDREAAAKRIPEQRLKEAVLTHKAWLSIDGFGEIKEADREQAYRLIGKFMAELAGDDVLALYLPESGKLVWNSPDVQKKLKGEHPLEAFDWDDPIIDVPDDDPAMKAAVAKARETFPQFATAFAKPKPGQHFSAKGHFGKPGDGEYMWITVTSIEKDVIRGKLDNMPARAKDLHVGDNVEIKVAELNDWLIAESDRKTLTGGYTIEVLRKTVKNRSEDK